MNRSTEDDVQPAREDIIFECPECGKSLEIDAKGAGYLIVCPDCKHEIQVPSWQDLEENEPFSSSDTTRIDSPSENENEQALAQLRVKIEQLERRQKTDDVCFKRLGDEINLIQAAVDRITEIVESRQSEG